MLLGGLALMLGSRMEDCARVNGAPERFADYGSIGGGPLDMVDHQKRYGAAGRFQFQSECLEGVENSGGVAEAGKCDAGLRHSLHLIGIDLYLQG